MHPAVRYAQGAEYNLDILRFRIEQLVTKGSMVCDVGGGAHPFLTQEETEELGIRYSLLDISSDELNKCSAPYDKIVCDISGDLDRAHALGSDDSIDLYNKFDVVFSVMTAEHIPDAERFHQNVFAMLKPGGSALHVFPTLYALPFVVNKLLPESVTATINHVLSPDVRR